MFGDCCQRHLKWFRHIRDSHIIFQQHRQYLSSRWIGKGGKDRIKGAGLGHRGEVAPQTQCGQAWAFIIKKRLTEWLNMHIQR